MSQYCHFQTRRQGLPLRSQWRCSRPIVIIGVPKYEAIFADPKLRQLASIVTHLQIVPLLLAYRFSTP